MKVKDGQVQRKNRHVATCLQACVIDRESPGKAARHVLTKRDLLAFIDLIPDWPRLSERLERIVLSRRDEGADGYYEFFRRERTGGIFLCAWDEELWVELQRSYFDEHRSIFERIGLSFDEGKTSVTCRFTESQARAFMLLHIFLHELGHHFDRLTQKNCVSSRGEVYAERFASTRFELIYRDYIRVFGDPARG